MAKKTVNIGIIGGGMMAQVGHIPFLLGHPACEVTCVAESRPSLVAYLREHFGVRSVVGDQRELLARPEIDAVVLSAPRPATGPLSLEVLEAGKHLLAEKPMAHSASQARELVEAARTRGLLYMVGYMKRYDPGIQKASEVLSGLVSSGRLGAMLLARFYNYSKSYAHTPPEHQRPGESREARFDTWPMAPDWMPANRVESFAWFMNSASHDINLLRLFFEAASARSAVVADSNAFAASLSEGDTLISLDIAPSQAGRWLEGAEFLFERGRLSFCVPSPMDVDGVTRVALQENARDYREVSVETGTGWSFERQIEGFLRALRGDTRPATSGDDGLKDLELIEALWSKALGG